MRAKTISIRAPAKVNLYLEVLGRRSNGFHEIRSILMPVSLCDAIRLQPCSDGISTTMKRAGMIPGWSVFCGEPDAVFRSSSTNLATCAAVLLRRRSGHRGGARIHIVKRIPVGGGLGGGSSDAAAVLVALNRIWNLSFSVEELMKLGARIGYDVPAMIAGRPVCARGLGEIVTPIQIARSRSRKPWWFVIANPGLAVSTRDVYTRYRQTLTPRPGSFTRLVTAVEKDDTEAAAACLFNSLQATVFAKFPIIEMTAERMSRAGAFATLLCGSGASVFGLARDRAHACAIARNLKSCRDFPLWCAIAHALPDGVMVAHGPLEA